ncbi:hypothetical protein J1614_012029 [Plenodomus biglobosus]|nr:hypothetical protein J1614_012029 [Plenodomus biglobosus]
MHDGPVARLHAASPVQAAQQPRWHAACYAPSGLAAMFEFQGRCGGWCWLACSSVELVELNCCVGGGGGGSGGGGSSGDDVLYCRYRWMGWMAA